MKSTIAAITLLASTASAIDLENLANEVNTVGTTWEASANTKWAGLESEVLVRRLGALEPESGMKNIYYHKIVNEIPDSFDAREAWPMCDSIKEIRDQSDCGSCWAFGAVEAASDRICITTKGAMQTRLSPDALLGCCDDCGYGCQGGYTQKAWDYMVDYGLPSGDLYGDETTCQPYSIAPGITTPAATPACRYSCDSDSTDPNTYQQEVAADKFAKSYQLGSTVDQIQTEIMTNGPVEAQFSVYEDFYTYTGGVYQHTTGQLLGGHAIRVLGWGEDNGTPYWLIANSWGADWGENGFFRILRGANECGIESVVVAGTYIAPSAMTNNMRGSF